MKTIDIIRRAGRGLKNSKARTALTSLAIAVGAFTLTLTIAAGQGANQYAAKLVSSNFDPAEIYVAKDKKILNASGGFSSPQEYDASATSLNGINIRRITQNDIKTIDATEGVQSVRPRYNLAPLYITKEGMKKYTTTIEAYSSTQKPDFVFGKGPGALADNEVLLPNDYVSLLGFASPEAAVGQTVNIVFRKTVTIASDEVQRTFLSGGVDAVKNLSPYEDKTVTFKVVGVTKKPATSFVAQLPLYVSGQKASELNDYTTKGTDNYQKYAIVFATVKNGDNKEARNKVVVALKAKGYNVITAEDTQATLMQFISVLQGIVAGFGVLALLASVFGIINTQYISVLERTREIGLMKALGMRGRHVSRLFQFEAAWIGFLGGVIGAGLAVIGGTLLNPWITTKLGLGEGTYILIFQPLPAVLLIAGLVFIAMAAGYLPARKAAKLDPIEALRTE